MKGIEIVPSETLVLLTKTLQQCNDKLSELQRENADLRLKGEMHLLSVEQIAKRWSMTPETARKHVENYGNQFRIKKKVFSDGRSDRWKLADILEIERRLEKDSTFKYSTNAKRM